MTNAENIGAPAARAVQKRASSSSFYVAMRLMPAEERDAMFAIYAFCRKADDIADDGVGTRFERHEKLEGWRRDLHALYEGSVGPQVRFLAPAVTHYGLRLQDFLSVLDGMDMDVAEDIVAPDLATLDLYCDRVASAVGRLSVRVFGMEEQDGLALAHHLGRALQLTNILRDLDEDAAFGRLYLPAQGLLRAGITATEPTSVLASPTLGTVCATVVERARRHFAQADSVMARNPRRKVRAPRIMAEAYFAILDALVARGWSAPRRPIHLPRGRLLWIIMRHAFV